MDAQAESPWHKEIHPRTPTEIAAQIWCESTHETKVMDIAFAQSIAAEIDREQRHATRWCDTAAQHCRNEEYYRGLVVKIGELFGEAAYISDDGSRQEDVLCAKVPELVRAHRDEIVTALAGAYHALRSYEFGNGSPDLAKSIADRLEPILGSAAGPLSKPPVGGRGTGTNTGHGHVWARPIPRG